MKYHIKVTTLLFLINLTGKLTLAQDPFSNGGFETWTTRTAGSATYQDPTNWYSLNSLVQYGFEETTTQTTQAHSGQYATMLESKTMLGQTIPGLLTVNFMLGTNGSPDLAKNMIPYTSRPASLEFWYISNPQDGDSNSVFMVLTKWNTATANRDTIGKLQWKNGEIKNTYTKAIIAVEYLSNQTPDSMFFIMSSSLDGFNPIEGSLLIIDDLQFITQGSGLTTLKEPNQIIVYPNPFNSEIRVSGESLYQIQVYSAAGQLLSETGELTDNTLQTGDLIPGVYYIKVRDLNTGAISTYKTVKK